MPVLRISIVGSIGLVAACGTSSLGREEAALSADQCAHFAVDGKVQICHATGSATNPYRVLRVSESGCTSGHSLHAGDYIAVGDPTCQGLGCLPVGAPCDASLPCCDGSSCQAGTCVADVAPRDGCPEGSYARSYGADGLSFTYIFDRFVASQGPGIDAAEAYRTCEVSFTFEVPFGRTWLMSWDHRGYVQLADGASGEQSATYRVGTEYLDGIGLDVDGPTSHDYLIRDELQEGAFAPAMCDGGTVTVSAEARIQVGGPADSNLQMTTDSMDGHVTVVDCSGT